MTKQFIKHTAVEVVASYIEDYNFNKTARRLGMHVREVKEIVDMNSSLVKELVHNREVRTKVDADFVLKSLHDMAIADLKDVMNDDGTPKPVSEWPTVWRTMVRSIEVKELKSRDGQPIGAMTKIKAPETLSILRDIGKHNKVNAFIDRIEVVNSESVADKILAGRERLALADKESSE